MFHFTQPIFRIAIALLLTLSSSVALSQTAGKPQMDLPRAQLQAGMHLLQVQVASTGKQREVGLMWRKEMPIQEGMLFVFEQAAGQCFWMRNTLIPLTAAFIADDGTIVNLADMQPQSDTSHCSGQPVRFVLEMNQGWFAKRGIRAGQKIGGPYFRP
ncbi:MAG: hypothetical protein RL364_784 [Pseudomonadota bacterium]|jgi:uncharacterized membrane protein (UPF0127 family)